MWFSGTRDKVSRMMVNSEPANCLARSGAESGFCMARLREGLRRSLVVTHHYLALPKKPLHCDRAGPDSANFCHAECGEFQLESCLLTGRNGAMCVTPVN